MDLRLATPRRLLRHRFVKETMTLQAGSFAAFGIQFLASVIIANELGVPRYGTFGLAWNLFDLVSTLANLAVGQALITRLAAALGRRDREESSNLVAYSLKLGLLVGLIQAALGLLGVGWLGALMGYDPQVGDLARMLFLIPAFSVAFNTVVLALQSSRQASRLTLLENGVLVGTSVMNTVAVALGGGIQGLIYTTTLAPLLASLGALLLYNATFQTAGLPAPVAVLRASLRVPLRRYFTFSAWISADKSFAKLITLAPTTLLGMLSTEGEVAYFRLGYNLMNFLSVPISPIARNLYAALSQVALKQGPGGLGRALLRATLLGGAISVAGSGVMMLASPYILHLYRPEYAPVQVVIYALGLRFALLGFGVGLGPIYQVLNAMKLAILTKIVPALIILGAGWAVIGQYGAVGAAWTLVAAYVVGDIVNALLVPWMLRKEVRANADPIVRAGACNQASRGDGGGPVP